MLSSILISVFRVDKSSKMKSSIANPTFSNFGYCKTHFIEDIIIIPLEIHGKDMIDAIQILIHAKLKGE
jgi:hypothetical protein